MRGRGDLLDVTSRGGGQGGTDAATYAGSLRRPRWGTGARYGESVSTSSRSSGQSGGGGAHVGGGLEGDDAGERQVGARVEAPAGLVGTAGEAVEDGALRARPRRRARRRCRPTPPGCGSRAARSRSWARPIWAANAGPLHVARRVVVVVVEAALADGHDAAARSSSPTIVSTPWPASWGWRPTVAHTSSWAAARAMAAGAAVGVGADGDEAARRRRPAPRRGPRRAAGQAVVVEVAVAVGPSAPGGRRRRRRCLRGNSGSPLTTAARPGSRPSGRRRAGAGRSTRPGSPMRSQIAWAAPGHGRRRQHGDDAQRLEGVAQHGVDRGAGLGLPRLVGLEVGVGGPHEPPGGLERLGRLHRGPAPRWPP